MKTLLIVRHAKSNSYSVDFSDFERTLNETGMQNAAEMAELIAKKLNKTDKMKIISSPAIRALTTAKIFAKSFNYNEDTIETDLGFYERGVKYIIKILATQNDKNEIIAIFGHNPTISSLISFFIGETVGNLPTCSVSCIDFDMENWKNIDKINGKLRFFEKPLKDFLN